mgnify:CR=1 FL=1
MAAVSGVVMSSSYYGPTFESPRVMSESVANYVLDILGFVPVIGNAADLVNALMHASAGELLFAGLSLLAAIPVIGWVFTPFKWIVKIAQVVSGVAGFGADHEGHEERVARGLEKLEDTVASREEDQVQEASIEIKGEMLKNKPRIDAGLDEIEKEAAGSKLGEYMPKIRKALDDFASGRTRLAAKKPVSRQLPEGRMSLTETQLRSIVRKAIIVYG